MVTTTDNDTGQDASDQARMTKAQAIARLGGTQAEAAARIGVSPQAVQAWPQVLTDKLRDRVQAALWREHCADMAREMMRTRRRGAALLQARASEHADR